MWSGKGWSKRGRVRHHTYLMGTHQPGAHLIERTTLVKHRALGLQCTVTSVPGERSSGCTSDVCRFSNPEPASTNSKGDQMGGKHCGLGPDAREAQARLLAPRRTAAGIDMVDIWLSECIAHVLAFIPYFSLLRSHLRSFSGLRGLVANMTLTLLHYAHLMCGERDVSAVAARGIVDQAQGPSVRTVASAIRGP
jgi:hypothetical protein